VWEEAMNDFTKEELELIIHNIKLIRIFTQVFEWDSELDKKVKSMIAGYDEDRILHQADIERQKQIWMKNE
jgi:hypothetical protein